MNLLLTLFIASFVGSFIWIVQSCTRPLTQKFFSQTWHYYTALIPVFFLLGGTEWMIRLRTFIRSFFSDTNVTIKSESIGNPITVVPVVEQATTDSPPLMGRWVDSLLQIRNLQDWVVIFFVIWIAGMIVFLAVNAKNYYTFKRLILQESHAADIDMNAVKIVVSSNAMTPMVIGFLNPVIVMPHTRFDKKELSMILSHERIHLKRRDLLVKFIVLLANSIHWFNPLVYSLSKQTNMFCELSCDEKVVQDMDVENRRFYGETLLSMLEYGVMRKNLVGVSCLYHAKEDMKRRLGNLMRVKKTKQSMVVLSLAASVVLLGCGMIASNYASAAKNTSSSYLLEGVSYVTLINSDGTMISYDIKGNVIPRIPRQPSKALSTDEIVDRIVKYMGKGLPVPEGYVVDLKKQGKANVLADLFDDLTNIDLSTQDGVATFHVADLLNS